VERGKRKENIGSKGYVGNKKIGKVRFTWVGRKRENLEKSGDPSRRPRVVTVGRGGIRKERREHHRLPSRGHRVSSLVLLCHHPNPVSTFSFGQHSAVGVSR